MSTPGAPLPAVHVDGVTKSFRLPKERVHTLKERVLHPLRRQSFERLDALQDVSLSVRPGEFFGIVGRNGSGKSTLLKCLAGIYRVDGGRIFVNGRVSTFIELGVGFNPDLPARDNVALNATMLGLSAKESRYRFDAIIDFAELHDYTDLKLKNYSSGMMVRLAFSVMIQVDADILLIDEVLAVGDASFQQKCFEEFERIRRSGKTVLLVTHDMGAVRRFCDRAMLLEHGHVVADGDPQAVGNRYLELNFSSEARSQEAAALLNREPVVEELVRTPDQLSGNGRAEIRTAWFEHADGRRTEALSRGEDATFVMRVAFHEEVVDPRFGLELVNSTDQRMLAASTGWEDPHPGTFRAGEEAVVRVTFPVHLGADRYLATPYVEREGHETVIRRDGMLQIAVTDVRPSGALAELPYAITVERSGAASEVAS